MERDVLVYLSQHFYSNLETTEYIKLERKLSLWGLIIFYHGIQSKFTQNLKISARQILFYNTIQIIMINKTLKEARTCDQLDRCIPSHTLFHKLHLSVSQDNTVFETSLLALNQDTKEYMTAAKEFLFRSKWIKCISASHANGHETIQDNQNFHLQLLFDSMVSYVYS